MTEYGRGTSSEPWHPEDPLYGDGGWGGQQAPGGQSPYDGHPQHYAHQSQHGEQTQYADWGGAGGQDGYAPGHQGVHGHEYQQGGYDLTQQQYGGAGPQQYTDQGGQQHIGHQGGWDTGQQHVPHPADPVDPYAGQDAAYTERPDLYGTPDAYPPPEPPARRQAESEPRTDWDPGPDQGEHAFFAGDDEDDGPEDGPGRRGDRRSRGGKGRNGGKGKKSRNGVACMVVALVLVGGVGGVGYVGYKFYQNRFGAAPDYAGEGSGSVTVTIPKGAGGYAIGNALKDAGVVKSVDAFVAAQAQNPDGNTLQAGVYTLRRQMSAESAVALMLSPKSRNNLVVAEGKRNADIYKMIDKRLGVKAGTTEDVAKEDWKSLGLPEWADSDSDIKDPLEGFLYPSSYPVSKGMKPQDVLKEMINQAKAEYASLGLEEQAQELGLEDPLQVLTVASLVQAEGKSKDDFEKVARVVYNRLKPDNTETYGLLDFDSTVNYLRGESKLATGSVDDLRKLDDPYNTYKIKGLPPGPIGNPGEVAIKAALNPADGNWYYFVSVSEDETLFAETNEEQNRNREKYLEELKKNGS
ncbi:membrane protein [Streptomyces minutiscleroticus]|uniref:Endolytic murein transglycosylase n=1 Tax=Streptomyces minutiscleroticus TaxID=68238 RepID=A0A918NSP0_9ACTN|nr:endolytic transglycosylase MltG [Streptomyces minutiscleroticus]GGX91709.1 membrane protein [Streptomyces minutiscleroticus]